MFDLIELQRKLQEARNEIHPSKVRLRTAATDDANKLLSAYYTRIPCGKWEIVSSAPPTFYSTTLTLHLYAVSAACR